MAAIKLVLVIIFIFFTAPTASHAVAKAALMANIIPQCQDGKSVVDESLGHIYHSKDKSLLDMDDDEPSDNNKGAS